MLSPRWVGTLFFTEGLPASIVAVVSAVLLKRLGVANEDIAFAVSALVLPWSCKPLWSPLFESARVRRLTVVVTEWMMALALAGIAAGLASPARAAIAIFLLALVALCAATHDIAADGLFVCALAPETQRRLVGRITVAFNLAKLLAQGAVVVLAGRLERELGVAAGWQVVFALFASLLAALAAYHTLSLPRGAPSEGSPGPVAAFLRAAASLVRRRDVARLLALVVVYRLAEGLLVRVAPLFLIDAPKAGGLGLTTAQLGLCYGGLGTCAFMAGALVGGGVSANVPPRRALVLLCAAYHLSALIYLALSAARPASVVLIGAAILVEQLTYGIGTIGIKLILFQLVADGPYKTAHFAFASGLSGVGASATGLFAGLWQHHLGYPAFFTGVVALSILAVLAVYGMTTPGQPKMICTS